MIAECVSGRCRHRKLSISLCFGSLVKNLLCSWIQPCLLLFIEVVKTDSQTCHCWREMWRVKVGRKDCEFKLDKILCLWKLKLGRFILCISNCQFFIETSIKGQLFAVNFLWAGFSLGRMVSSQCSSAVLQLLWCFTKSLILTRLKLHVIIMPQIQHELLVYCTNPYHAILHL